MHFSLYDIRSSNDLIVMLSDIVLLLAERKGDNELIKAVGWPKASSFYSVEISRLLRIRLCTTC